MQTTRQEQDSIGKVDLPAGCLHGIQTERARRNFPITGVPLSHFPALVRSLAMVKSAAARANAEAEGVADRARFEAHDLEQNLPQGAFDLVTSMFMQSPMDFDRIGILRRASRQIAPGGLLLIGAHAARPSWSEEEGPEPFPSAEEDFAALALDPAAWRVITVGHETRPAKGPEGQEGFHTDSVIALERR